MKWNRSWPGVPNRYSTISGVSEMRPKSMATVVVCLVEMCDRSSDLADAVVIIASERSGSISEMVLTKVDLPTPKPPATTILTGILPRSWVVDLGYQRLRTPSSTLSRRLPKFCVATGVVEHNGAVVDEVGDEHSCYADREFEPGRELDQRHRRLDELDQPCGFPPVRADECWTPGAGLDLGLESDVGLGRRCGRR